jgi:hypothetical protein
VTQEKLETVFGKNLLQDRDLWPLLQQLSGMTGAKPFDCIGTAEEVNAALHMTLARIPETSLPELLKLYKSSDLYPRYKDFDSGTLLHSFNETHFLPKEYEALLRSKINV